MFNLLFFFSLFVVGNLLIAMMWTVFPYRNKIKKKYRKHIKFGWIIVNMIILWTMVMNHAPALKATTFTGTNGTYTPEVQEIERSAEFINNKDRSTVFSDRLEVEKVN